MKVYLILEYKRQNTDVWAEVQAFTSASVRDREYAKTPHGADVEKLDVEVQKREYKNTKEALIADLIETKVPVNG